MIQQEKGKDGLYALGTNINIGTKILHWFSYLLNIHPDVIVFYPNKEAFYYSIESIRKGGHTPYDPSFYYELVDILDPKEGLWERWNNRLFIKMENFMVVRQIRHGYGKKDMDLNFQKALH